MQRFVSIFAIGVLAATASAQFSIVIPNGMAAAEGSTSNAFPWGRGGTGIRIQTIYDSSHFTTQGITYPIFITGLRWRPNTGVALTASGYPSLNNTVKLSTCPVDQSAVTTTFANQIGADVTTCYQGPVSWAAQPAQTGPTPFGIVVPFTTNFLYDPSLGDLNIECEMPIQTVTGTPTQQLDVHGTAPLASRAYLTTSYTPGGPTATGITLNHGVVVQVDYLPAAGLYPNFTGTPRTGPVNTLVNFTDQTYTSDPGGITSWAWDVDGDSITDYTTQNCSHTYTTEGNYNVTLTVTSAMFGTQTLTKNNYVSIDAVHASFTTAFFPGNIVAFTDTSTGNPTTWAWDFTNDGIVDSTAQNPAFAYPTPGQYTCRLTVTDAFSSDTTTTNLGVGIIPVPGFGSTFASTAATRGFWFQAPTRFSVVTARVPDETNNGTQNVALYRLAAAPPVYSATATGGLEFVAVNQPSASPIPCAVSFDTGEFVGVLGACGTTTMQNSYATPVGPFASSVLGVPTTLTRMGTQFNLFSTGGTTAYWQEPAAAISRVILGVTACAALPYGVSSPSGAGPAGPTMRATALPFIGSTSVLSVTQNDTNVLMVMAVGFGRASLPSPYGVIQIGSILGSQIMNGAAVVGPGTYTHSFTIPNDPSYVGLAINWQNANLLISTGQVSLSNGIEYWLDI